MPRLTTLLALLLAAVLVMTQTLGVIHGMTHGASGSSLHAHDQGHDHDHEHAHDGADASGASHFLSALFSSHQKASDCRLFDQASHDGALVIATPPALPVVLPPVTVAIFQGEALARWVLAAQQHSQTHNSKPLPERAIRTFT